MLTQLGKAGDSFHGKVQNHALSNHPVGVLESFAAEGQQPGDDLCQTNSPEK